MKFSVIALALAFVSVSARPVDSDEEESQAGKALMTLHPTFFRVNPGAPSSVIKALDDNWWKPLRPPAKSSASTTGAGSGSGSGSGSTSTQEGTSRRRGKQPLVRDPKAKTYSQKHDKRELAAKRPRLNVDREDNRSQDTDTLVSTHPFTVNSYGGKSAPLSHGGVECEDPSGRLDTHERGHRLDLSPTRTATLSVTRSAALSPSAMY